MRVALERHARVQLAQALRALAQQAQMLPTLAPRTPQVAPPLRQPASNSVPTGGIATRQVYQGGSHFRLLCQQSCSHRWSGH